MNATLFSLRMLRHLTPFTFAFSILLFCFGNTAVAEPLPSGSYTQTCRDYSVHNRILTATCKPVKGSWQTSNLDTSGCGGSDVINVNGTLRCNAHLQGNFNQSCSAVYIEGNTLHGLCKTFGQNQVRESHLSDFVSCLDPIRNMDGWLDCPKGDGIIWGTYWETCRDVSSHGNTVTATCRMRSGQYHTSTLNLKACPTRTGPENQNGSLGCGYIPSAHK